MNPEEQLLSALSELSEMMDRLDRVRRVYRWLKQSPLMDNPNAGHWLAALERHGNHLKFDISRALSRLVAGVY